MRKELGRDPIWEKRSVPEWRILRGRWAMYALVGGVFFCLATPGKGMGQESPPLPENQPEAGAGVSRADSLRSLVIEHLRAPAPDPDAADTLEVEDDTPSTLSPNGQGMGSSSGGTVAPPDGADPFMEALLGLNGATSSAYEGTRISFEIPRRNIILFGDEERGARFLGQGMQLAADTAINYDDYLGVIRTQGAAEFVPENGAPVLTERLVYSLAEDRGTALQAETVYTEGVSWIVRGDLDSVRDGELFASSTIFTSCELDHPHSYFKADRIKILAGQIMVTGPVKLYFADVPVLVLPFFVQNLGSGRASGLLTPVFSVNDIVRSSGGYNRRVANLGYYWAMSDYSDMTVAMDWYSNQYIAMETRLGYRWARQFLNGTVDLKHYWRETGSRELALNTRHEWIFSERTRLSVSGRYVSNSNLVLQNSLDPRELTQTIDSDGSFSRRFDWGTLSLGASRRQYLSEEKTDMTLPSLNLSLSTISLFGAPAQSARWYNNISLSGSGSMSRKVRDRVVQPDSTFTFANASQLLTQAGVRGSLGVGDLALSGNLDYDEDLFRDVPLDPEAELSPRGEFRAATANWGAGLSYRLRLIGSTTLTPSINIGAAMLRVDSIPEAANFVQGPIRRSMGVGLQTEIYGFWGGVGPFEAIRHKLSPSVSWSYSPEVQATDLQKAVFGSSVSRRTSTLVFSLNQTWEGKVSEESQASAPSDSVGRGIALGGDPLGIGGSADQVQAPQEGEVPQDSLVIPVAEEGGPTRLPPSRTRQLLGLTTGGITYDMVRADSTGKFIDGFMTTSLSTTISSDYLRGLSLSFTHDLFDDSDFLTEGVRSFAPHLSQLALGFSMSDQSGVVQVLTRLLGGAPDEEPPVAEAPPETPFGAPEQTPDPLSGFDPNRVIPGSSSALTQAPMRSGGWDAQISYSLRRPRPTDVQEDQGLFGGIQEPTAQMISTTLAFSPTEMWSVGWVTSYDVEARRFSDHVVRLTRDLHEWDASFGFRQTPLGNWSFQFEVSLKANRDMRFDYEQRSLQGQPGF